MTDSKHIQWPAAQFFRDLTARNRLAASISARFAVVSGLEGFYGALSSMKSAPAIIAVSDSSQGRIQTDSSPRTTRIKTVFFAIRHKIDDQQARQRALDNAAEIFRQFMSMLILEKTRLAQQNFFIDPDITFNEIDRHFYPGTACAYFQISETTYTDLRYDPDEWLQMN